MARDPLSAEVTPEELAELRGKCPVSRTDRNFWYVARYDDALAGMNDVHAFNASFRDPGVVVPPEEQFINEIEEPRHGHVRKIINSAIATHRLTSVGPFCRQLCDDLLTQMRTAAQPIDLVDSYIMAIPNSVIAHLLGAKPEDYPRWAAWSDEVVLGTYPTQYRNERGSGLAGAHPEFTEYVDALIADRRAAPRDDFISRLLAREVDGRRLTDVEARTQLVFLFISGNETTRHLIGNLMQRLVHEPELAETLRADRSLIPAAIEESLRTSPPVRFLLRDCTTAGEHLGTEMAAHDKVVFGIESANRDESRFDDADDFRLDRGTDGRRHLAFGGGPHVCPGATLARLEAQIAVEAWLDHVTAAQPEIESVTNVATFWARGPQSLPVRITFSSSGTDLASSTGDNLVDAAAVAGG
jgi:cytochrome P450